MGKVIGIDLGTTNSCVAFVEDGTPKVIPTRLGENTIPSMVAFDKGGQRLVGSMAKRQPPSENVLYETKRLIGRRFEECSGYAKDLGYKIVKSNNGDTWVEVRGTQYSPSQIGSYILQTLKEDAEAYLGEKITQAVITVPAYFNDAQRQATKDAGKIAGLEVLRIVNEPTAAALAYGLDKNKSGKIAVYDLGGGTFDISILEIEDGVFEVLATNGDTMLGGGDFDQRIIKFLAEEYHRIHGKKLNLEEDKMALRRLKDAAEKAKIELSSTTQTDINLPFLSADESGPKHLETVLTRAKLESLVNDLIERSIEPCRKALKDAGVSIGELSDVILVGGMTRMPKVVERVKEFFGKDPHRKVNPDEVVALGAAIQGGILQGEVKGIVLLDVTPLTLGIETEGGVLSTLISRNTTIPTKKSQIYSTASDNQSQVQIRIFQGERSMAADNKLLGEFFLEIPPAPRGVPQIEVTFDINADGILVVSAKDKATNKVQSISIKSSGGLSEEEIKKMMADAELYAEADKHKKELVEKKNQAESLIYSVEKNLQDHGSKLPEEEKKKIEESLGRVKQVKDSDDLNTLNSAIDDLTKSSMKLGEILYKEAQAGGSEGNAGGSENHGQTDGSDENIIDVEPKQE